MTLIQSSSSIILVLAIAGGACLMIAFVRGFKNFGLRAKIVIGILTTGGIALSFLSYFAISNTNQITDSLSGRLETSVSLLAEEQLINTVVTESELANQSFEEISHMVVNLSRYWSNLEDQETILAQGTYWDATTRLVQLPGGQYGNSPNDLSSVFVPANVNIDEGLIKRLNTSAYLDFYAPEVIAANPAILAVYGIDQDGVTRYYPNINLASLLPPDFDPTKRPYYEITSPLFNSRRLARWAIPYNDPAGGGLVVTIAAPVYFGDEFAGVVAADMKLASITKQVGDIRIGQTGYAFMLDDAGRIISMPLAGYALFGIDPATVNPDEYYKQTVLSSGTDELGATTRRMVAGGSGLLVAQINNIDTYIGFAPIRANGYSVGVVVPVSELQSAIITARTETEEQVSSATRTAFIILSILFLAGIAVSLGLGGIIAAPILRLTQTANQIVGGDLSAQAMVTSRDEIGILANAFNTMTERLRETLAGLEQRVVERTSELLTANQKNEQRARQFEAIAKVARTISSTKDLDTLLPQIAHSISTQFGFYHVGIFLLDPRKEYAVLSAANSDSGKTMVANNHKLKVGETGIVGVVTGTGKPRIALDTDVDAVFFDNALLPETRSELALPIISNQEILGALDVQSKTRNAFDQDDINILTALAEQVSIAIQNATQYEESQRALAESESLSRQFIKSGWQEFNKTRKLIGVRHSGARATMLYRKNGRAQRTGDEFPDETEQKSKGAVLSIPLKLHDETIGMVDVRTPHNRPWDRDELDIVNAIIERATLSLENARLLEESQKRAAKEHTIGEISAKISAQSKIDELIKTAVKELGRALPGAEVVIQFKQDDRTKGR
ncbi:MAG TPA: GAF domain-containing protein [Anaerolineales bacterium]|nr:GAF domain-containing protein [Anaerolineales bacterium]